MAVSPTLLVRLNGFCGKDSSEESLLGVSLPNGAELSPFLPFWSSATVLLLGQVRPRSGTLLGVVINGGNVDYLF